MENKVWIVFIEQVDSNDFIRLDYKHFHKEEEARKYFEDFVNDEKKSIPEHWVIDNEYDNDNIFEAYEEGYYSINHTIAKIEHCDIF